MHKDLIDQIKKVNNNFDSSIIPNNVYENIIFALQAEYVTNLIELEGKILLINRSIEDLESMPKRSEEEDERIAKFAIDDLTGTPIAKEMLKEFGREIALSSNILRQIAEVDRLKGSNEYTLEKINYLKNFAEGKTSEVKNVESENKESISSEEIINTNENVGE